MVDAFTFQLGPIAVSVEGRHAVTDWAARVFGPVTSVVDPAVRFRMGAAAELDDPSAVGDEATKVGRDAVWFRLRRFDMSVRRGGSQWDVDLTQRDRRSIWLRSLADPEEAWKMWLSHGRSLDAHLLKEFAYTISPLVFQCALMEHGAALIHASAFEHEGRGVLLPAWGGVGKSTVVSRCVLHGKARFLADDHAVIDSAGDAHLHLLPMHMYSYHARQDALLRQRMLSTLTAGQRSQWQFANLVRPTRAVRWLSPADLFGQHKLARRAALEQVIVMFRGAGRGDGGEPVWEKISAADAARPCAAVVFEEINAFADRLAMANAGWVTPILPDPGHAYRRLLEIYESAFAKASCARVLIPRGMDGEALMKFLSAKCPLIAAASAR